MSRRNCCQPPISQSPKIHSHTPDATVELSVRGRAWLIVLHFLLAITAIADRALDTLLLLSSRWYPLVVDGLTSTLAASRGRRLRRQGARQTRERYRDAPRARSTQASASRHSLQFTAILLWVIRPNKKDSLLIGILSLKEPIYFFALSVSLL